MMAFERTPTPPTLDAATIDSLRSALSRSIDQGSHSSDVQQLLHKAAVEAREKSIQPEQLLIVLKDIWYSLPAVARAKNEEAVTKLLQELITGCIQQYYKV